MSGLTLVRYELLVQDVYKSKITSDTLAIYTGVGGGDCGIRFELGNKYIVYGEEEAYFKQMAGEFKFPKGRNIFWTYNCLRTTSYFQEEATEIEKLVKKKK